MIIYLICYTGKIRDSLFIFNSRVLAMYTDDTLLYFIYALAHTKRARERTMYRAGTLWRLCLHNNESRLRMLALLYSFLFSLCVFLYKSSFTVINGSSFPFRLNIYKKPYDDDVHKYTFKSYTYNTFRSPIP